MWRGKFLQFKYKVNLYIIKNVASLTGLLGEKSECIDSLEASGDSKGFCNVWEKVLFHHKENSGCCAVFALYYLSQHASNNTVQYDIYY